MIVERAGRYVVVSATTGRRFGTDDTPAEAEERLRQIEFFEHLSPPLPSLRCFFEPAWLHSTRK